MKYRWFLAFAITALCVGLGARWTRAEGRHPARNGQALSGVERANLLREMKRPVIAPIPRGPRPDILRRQPFEAKQTLMAPDGSRWVQLDAPEGAGIQDVTADPYVPDRVFATSPAGLYISSDDGWTWSLVPGLRPNPATSIGSASVGFVRQDSDTLYFAGMYGLWRSEDGGDTWEAVAPAQLDIDADAVAVSPSDPNRILVSLLDFSTNTDQGLWFSTDGGQAFSKVDIGGNWVNPKCLAFALSDGSVAWAVTWDNSIYNPGPNPYNSPVVYKSVDGGATWSLLPIDMVYDGWALIVNPNDPNDIYVGTIGLGYALRRITGAGIQSLYSYGDYSIAVDPESFERLYRSGPYNYAYYSYDSSGSLLSGWYVRSWGAYSSSDGGMNWSGLGAEIPVAYDSDFSASINGLAMTGNGTLLAASSESRYGLYRYDPVSRSFRPSCRGMHQSVYGMRVNPADAGEAWVAVSGSGLFHTADGGAQWDWTQPENPLDPSTLSPRGNNPPGYTSRSYYGWSGQPLTGPVLLDPLTLGTNQGAVQKKADGFWAALSAEDAPQGSFLYVYGLTWDSAPCGTQGNAGVLESTHIGLYRACLDASTALLDGTQVFQAWEDPSDPGHILAASASGLQETKDGGNTWSTLYSTSGVRSVAVDPANSSHLLVGAWDAAAGTDDLYQSSDAGANWSAAGLNFGVIQILSVPGSSGEWWVVGEDGSAYHSLDNGASWSPDFQPGDSCGGLLDRVDAASSAPSAPWFASPEGGVYRLGGSIPSAPTGLVVTDDGTGSSLAATWDANPESDIAGYTVFYGLHGSALAESLKTTSTSAALTGLQSYATYDVAVGARNTAGQISLRSAISSAQVTCGSPPPPAPTLVSPTDGAAGASCTPTLSWAASQGSDHYRVQAATDPHFMHMVLDVDDIPATQYTVGDSSTGTPQNPYWLPYLQPSHGTNPYNPTYNVYGSYYWRVIPGDGCGESEVPSLTSELQTRLASAAPVVTGVSPASGPTVGGTEVTITGANFASSTAVTFGGVDAVSFEPVSDSEITAVCPAHATGTVDIIVFTFYGGASATSSADQFTYVCPTISVDPASLLPPTLHVAYSQFVTAGGGTAPYAYSVSSGSLPAGLNLNGTTGEISGTPSMMGTSSFSITATDDDVCTGSTDYSLTVVAISLSPVTLPDGTAGVAYNQTLSAVGGTAPYTFSLSSGTPPGLTFTDNGDGTATLAGTPTQAGVFSLAVSVDDFNGRSASQTYSLDIACPETITVAPSSIPSGTAGEAYLSTDFSQTGGFGQISWSENGTLPAGMGLTDNGDGTATLGGTPTETGSFSITVTATDAYKCTGTQDYTLTINCPAVTIAPASLPDGEKGSPYPPTTFTQTGGAGAITWSFSGTLPTGMDLSTSGLLSGTPTQSGSFPITVTATDANGCTGNRSYTLAVTVFSVTAQATPTVVTTGETVQFACFPTGGSGEYVYAWSFGDGGLSVLRHPNHVYTEAGTYKASVTVTDSYGTMAMSDMLTIVVYDPLSVTLSASPTEGAPPLSVTFTAQAAGGDGSYTYIYGYGDGTEGDDPHHTYTSDGTYKAEVTVTDTASHSATSQPVTVTVSVNEPLSVDFEATATTGTVPFSVIFTSRVSGGDGNYTYEWDFGDGTTADIAHPTKTFTSVGTFSVSLAVTDGASHTTSGESLTVTVYAPLTVQASAAPNPAIVGNPVTLSASSSGGSGEYNVAWDLGDGSAGSGASLTHTYASTGTFNATATVTDPALSGTSAAATVFVMVQPLPPAITGSKKQANPFRIVLLGTNFQTGCTVAIDGVAVQVKVKDESKIKLKRCKDLCPKGVPVTIVVTNPDGGVSAPYEFTR